MPTVRFSDPPPTSMQPAVTIERWQVFEVGGGRHLVGFRPDAQRHRVSSPIAALNAASATATTASGRIYVLRGEPDRTGEAAFVWAAYCDEHTVLRQSRSVTARVWSQIKRAVRH